MSNILEVPQQQAIQALVAKGWSVRHIARSLGITVKKHLEHIFEKLGVEKRGAASLIALEALVA